MKSGELDLATGEIVLDPELEFDQYRPHGPCANCGEHPATELFQLYRGQMRYDFRCKCCYLLGKLERARWHASQIAKLEAEYAQIYPNCALKEKP